MDLRRYLRLLTANSKTKVGSVLVGIFILTAIAESVAGNAILPYDPVKLMVGRPLSPPSLAHPFGTNPLGMDVFSQIIAGTPNDAMVSFFVVAVGFAVGAVLGCFAGYSGGLIDEILMRVTDTFFAIPRLVLGMTVSVLVGPGPVNLMMVLAVIWWPTYARLARSEALRLSNAPFVESAKISGLPTRRVVLRHILTMSFPVLLVYATLDIGTVVFTYSGLSYLGLAVRPPQPDWGAMIAQSQDFLLPAPWLALIPATIIMLVVLGFSLLGDGLRDVLQAEKGR